MPALIEVGINGPRIMPPRGEKAQPSPRDVTGVKAPGVGVGISTGSKLGETKNTVSTGSCDRIGLKDAGTA